MFHLAPFYFHARSRIDYTDRSRVDRMSKAEPKFGDAAVVIDAVTREALSKRVNQWRMRVTMGDTSAEAAAQESAGFVSYPNFDQHKDLARLAFLMLTQGIA